MTQTTAHFVRMTVALRVQAWSEVDIHTNSHAMRRAAPSPRPQRQQNDGKATCTCDLLLLCALVSRPNKQRTERRGDTEAQQTRCVLLLDNSDGRSERQPQKSDARKAVSTTEIPVVWGDEQPVHCTARRGWCLLTTSKQEDPAS